MTTFSSTHADFDLRFTLRILVVTDGAISLWDAPTEPPDQNNDGFTLREMARALWDAPAAQYPYTSFQIDHAIHGTGTLATRTRTETDPDTHKTRTWKEHDAFRFDTGQALLREYNQIWFFGFWPGNQNFSGQFQVPSNRVPLSSAELKIVEAWMNAGGGVFATGDHGLLGAHLCGDMLRVNKMRHWTERGFTDTVPSATGSDRIDTIVPVRTINGQTGVLFEDQSDNVPKPLRLKRYTLWDGLQRVTPPPPRSPATTVITRTAPHPILCSPLGAIDILPDHMHEGLVREDDEVDLTSTDSKGHLEFPGGANKSVPEVIAWSTVRGDKVLYNDAGSATVTHRVVPTIAVYDGEPAKVGRVVVDSTWHNWLDINVRATGALDRPNPQTGVYEHPSGLLGKNLEQVHNYFRNIAQWLATKSERDWMRSGLFIRAVTSSGGWAESLSVRALLGQQASNVLGQVSSVCNLNGLVFEGWWASASLSALRQQGVGKMALPPKEFVQEHVLGAMVEEVFRLAPNLPRRQAGERREHKPDTTKEWQLISQRLGQARHAGLQSMVGEWRKSLKCTAEFLDAIESTSREGYSLSAAS